MSTGDTAVPLIVAQPLATTHSDSTMSSPLSEVKDAYPDEMDEDHSDLQPQPNDASDSTSNLSDIHSPPPESEAETDRLFDTPQKPIHHKDVFLDQNSDAKVFERSPSKLQHEVKPENVVDGAQRSPHTSKSPSAPPVQPPSEPPSPSRNATEIDATNENAANTDTESRKRKRSIGTDNSEPDEPLKKRTGSVGAADHDSPMVEPAGVEDAAPVQSRSGDHSAVEEEREPGQDKDDEAEPADHSTPEDTKLKKRKRHSTKSRKSVAGEASADVEDPSDVQDEESGQQPDDDNGNIAEEDHMDVDGEEEIDSTHKNEEEFEKKKMAYERLNTIEKHFATFRDRLFAERLEQLNKEEAMLKSDPPSHPDYLAMMRCLDARLEEKIRYADRQLQYDMESLNRSTVARRSQIMAQCHQGIRESREVALEDLGQEWYEIQHERRRHAGTVPEYGIKYPIQKAQRIRDAVAYNREVSILSGIAKYRGFPAAPELNGATSAEVEDDLEIISRSRQPAPSILHTFPEYGVTSRSLGPAGEQFLEQTPWANPNHPAHQQQPRHPSFGGPSNDSPLPRRHAVQHNPFAIHGSVPGLSNGISHKFAGGNRIQSESPTIVRSGTLDQHPKGGGVNTETGRSVKPGDLAVKSEAMAQATVA